MFLKAAFYHFSVCAMAMGLGVMRSCHSLYVLIEPNPVQATVIQRKPVELNRNRKHNIASQSNMVVDVNRHINWWTVGEMIDIGGYFTISFYLR
jgi:hypothetical protein